jgi:hypothetical protein
MMAAAGHYEVRRFDWEKRYAHSAWRVTNAGQAHRFAVALVEGGLPPQYQSNEANGTFIFWWDRWLDGDETDIATKALSLALGHTPSDVS